jgi:hypothetical protein
MFVLVTILRIGVVPAVVRDDLDARAFVVVCVVKGFELSQLGYALASRGLPVHYHHALAGVRIDIEPRAVVVRRDVVDGVVRERGMVVAHFQRNDPSGGAGHD